MARIQSVEPNVADKINGELKSYKLDYKLEQESLNNEIDNALKEYFTKNGGVGANRPDTKLLLQDKSLNFFPILIEYKGYEDKLEKLDGEGNIENHTAKNEPNLKNINSYAVNGAVHYANALLHHTSYTDIVAIGVTGYRDTQNALKTKIGVYYVSKSNLGLGQKVGDFNDLSFLKRENFDSFVDNLKNLSLTHEELEKIKQKREREIDASLVKLNNDIYNNEKGLGENDRVYLVAASIIATLGISGKVPPLEKSDLKSISEVGNSSDGKILMNKIEDFLSYKNLPQEKKDLIIRTLSNTILAENINKITNGETQLKRVFSKIVDDLGIYYKIGLTTDFTGKLFNEMYSWLGFTQDKLNDVVLTPSYVATLLVKLARVNKDSYVWDFATGSAGLLVAAMNEMLIDAKNSITSPDELAKKEAHIKAHQLLGLELLSSVYMLAILNMIMMGDGSSNILNKNSLTDFDGEYGFGVKNEKFPATAFVLNPPYSAQGNGMIFVETALNMMSKGYASVIIQHSAGNGKAKEINKRILAKNTLIASIKMPIDLFVGKSDVQTYIYVFKVGEKHEKDEMVKFIDFSNDGYTRTNRKKASNNLRDTDRAKERYEELVNLVRFGRSKLEIFSKNEYFESTIDPTNGADWNKSAPIDTKPSLDDFKKTVGDYLAWEVSQILKKDSPSQSRVSKRIENLEREFLAKGGEFKEYLAKDIFRVKSNPQLNKDSFKFSENGKYPYFTRTILNNGIAGYVDYLDDEHKIAGNSLAVGMLGMRFFYMEKDFYAGQFTKTIYPKFDNFNSKIARYFITLFNKNQQVYQGGLVRDFESLFYNTRIILPTIGGKISFAFMQSFIEELESERIEELEAYLSVTGLKDYKLTQKEKEALDKFSKLGAELIWHKFKIGDLFDRIKTKKLPYKAHDLPKYPNDEYVLPCLTSSFYNQGLNYFVPKKDVTVLKNAISIPSNSDVYRAYFQSQEFTVLSDAYAIDWKDNNKMLTKHHYLFMVMCINKVTDLPIYSYKNKLGGWNTVKSKFIQLPVRNDHPDYEFMNDFIKAIEKLVIKDVVLWADKKIEATKKAIA